MDTAAKVIAAPCPVGQKQSKYKAVITHAPYIKPTQLLVLSYMAYLEDHSTSGAVTVSMTDLAEALRLTRQRVYTIIAELEQMGVIVRIKTPGFTNAYRVMPGVW